jgi:hypothetical protein
LAIVVSVLITNFGFLQKYSVIFNVILQELNTIQLGVVYKNEHIKSLKEKFGVEVH